MDRMVWRVEQQQRNDILISCNTETETFGRKNIAYLESVQRMNEIVVVSPPKRWIAMWMTNARITIETLDFALHTDIVASEITGRWDVQLNEWGCLEELLRQQLEEGYHLDDERRHMEGEFRRELEIDSQREGIRSVERTFFSERHQYLSEYILEEETMYRKYLIEQCALKDYETILFALESETREKLTVDMFSKLIQSFHTTKLEHDMSTRLKRIWKGYTTRVKVAKLNTASHKAVLVLQRIGSAATVRIALGKEKNRHCRILALRGLSCVLGLQSSLHLRFIVKLTCDIARLKIQCCWRRYRARRLKQQKQLTKLRNNHIRSVQRLKVGSEMWINAATHPSSDTLAKQNDWRSDDALMDAMTMCQQILRGGGAPQDDSSNPPTVRHTPTRPQGPATRNNNHRPPYNIEESPYKQPLVGGIGIASTPKTTPATTTTTHSSPKTTRARTLRTSPPSSTTKTQQEPVRMRTETPIEETSPPPPPPGDQCPSTLPRRRHFKTASSSPPPRKCRTQEMEARYVQEVTTNARQQIKLLEERLKQLTAERKELINERYRTK
eukprot:PhF_6_TR12580/c0_g1_i1/m.19781